MTDSEALCPSCHQVQTHYKETKQPSHLLTICLPVKVLLQNKHHSEKEDKIREFVKKVSAIRNSGGGEILIHLQGKSESDRYLGNLDQFTDEHLPDLIEDGSVYTDNFYRSFLCDQDDFKEFTDFVVLDVRGSSSISTAHFNTRICSDQSVRRPTRYNILSLLRKSATKKRKQGENFGQNTKYNPKRRNLTKLHECRSVQLKTFPKDKVKKIKDNAEELAKYVWESLRLREYVCSMAMLDNGGSYYLGIKEKGVTITTGGSQYTSKVPEILGVSLQENIVQDLRRFLLEKGKTDIVVFCDKGEGDIAESDEQDILDINIVRGNDDIRVLEVTVKPLRGVVFFDCGPKSYHIYDKEIRELDTKIWFTKIQEKKTSSVNT